MTRASEGALTSAPTASMTPLRITTVPDAIVAPETGTIRRPFDRVDVGHVRAGNHSDGSGDSDGGSDESG